MELKCPHCNSRLIENGKEYNCAFGHSFDTARAGYINLLPVNDKNSKNPGDGLDMVAARFGFLHAGYYAPLAEKLISLGFMGSTLDIGCGEGYFTNFIAKRKGIEIIGVDISKYAIRYACRKVRVNSSNNLNSLDGGKDNFFNPNVISPLFIVASMRNLPIFDGGVNSVVNIFAPYDSGEVKRVLKRGGSFLKVTPGKKHLFGLKKLLYTDPYINEQSPSDKNFVLLEKINLCYEIRVEKKDIMSLFKMTPYYHKSPIESFEILGRAESLETEVDFDINIYRKEIV